MALFGCGVRDRWEAVMWKEALCRRECKEEWLLLGHIEGVSSVPSHHYHHHHVALPRLDSAQKARQDHHNSEVRNIVVILSCLHLWACQHSQPNYGCLLYMCADVLGQIPCLCILPPLVHSQMALQCIDYGGTYLSCSTYKILLFSEWLLYITWAEALADN